jgi:hypothetical protein
LPARGRPLQELTEAVAADVAGRKWTGTLRQFAHHVLQDQAVDEKLAADNELAVLHGSF